MKTFYNLDIVEREHKYFCRFGNKQANCEYTTVYSTDGNLEIQLYGKKSGSKKTFSSLSLLPEYIELALISFEKLFDFV